MMLTTSSLCFLSIFINFSFDSEPEIVIVGLYVTTMDAGADERPLTLALKPHENTHKATVKKEILMTTELTLFQIITSKRKMQSR